MNLTVSNFRKRKMYTSKLRVHLKWQYDALHALKISKTNLLKAILVIF